MSLLVVLVLASSIVDASPAPVTTERRRGYMIQTGDPGLSEPMGFALSTYRQGKQTLTMIEARRGNRVEGRRQVPPVLLGPTDKEMNRWKKRAFSPPPTLACQTGALSLTTKAEKPFCLDRWTLAERQSFTRWLQTMRSLAFAK